MGEIHLWTNEKKKGKKERMKKAKKSMQLLTISFLMAPMVLSTHTAFAFEEKEISEQNTVLESSSVTESTVDAMDKTSKITIMIDPVLIDRVQLKTQDGQVLTGSQDGVLEVEIGTKLFYTILADEEQESLALSINGGEEINLTNQTFVVGTQNIFITALVETTPDIPVEDPSKPNEDNPTTDSSTSESEEKTESSTDKTTNSSDSSNSPEEVTNTGNSGSHSSQSKPVHSSSPEQSKEESTNQTTSSVDNTLNKETTPPAKEKENGAMKEVKEPVIPSENSVTKKPINKVLSTNTNDQQQAIVQEALKHLGKPYLWGAKGPNQFDCSGLAYYVYLRATGYFIGTWTGEQQYAGTQIPINQAQPGDLLFWGSSTGVTTHVGIYLGENQFIHAPQPGEAVKITSISEYTPDFAVRIDLSKQGNEDLFNSSILNQFDDPLAFIPNQSTKVFLEKIAEDAREIGQKEGIYASVMLAQAILESGSGNSQLSREPNYNLFGIKGSYKGESITYDTFEQDNTGKSYQVKAEFCKYPSYKESLENYAQLIKEGIAGNKDFYKPVWKSETANYQEATSYLQGRYATDQKYAQKLNKIIETYDLTQYDKAPESDYRKNKWLSIPLSTNSLLHENRSKAKNITYYFSSSKALSIFDLWYYFSLKKIPEQQQVKTIKANELTPIRRAILKKVYLLHLLLQKEDEFSGKKEV